MQNPVRIVRGGWKDRVKRWALGIGKVDGGTGDGSGKVEG